LINTQSLSIVIDKPIPLSIVFPNSDTSPVFILVQLGPYGIKCLFPGDLGRSTIRTKKRC
jgi:hypothetical protein